MNIVGVHTRQICCFLTFSASFRHVPLSFCDLGLYDHVAAEFLLVFRNCLQFILGGMNTDYDLTEAFCKFMWFWFDLELELGVNLVVVLSLR